MSSSKAWTFRIVILLLTLALLETVLRIFGVNATYLERVGKEYNSYWGKKMDTWYWTLSPDITFTEKNIDFTYPVTTNSFGHREKEPEEIFADTTKRIITLGDSFTEGVGVVYDSAFPRHLQRILNEHNIPAAVYNAGSSGSDPLFYYTMLRDKLAAPCQPHIILIVINSSDYYDLMFRGGFERFQSDSTTVFKAAPWYEPVYRYSYIFRFLVHSAFGFIDGDIFITPKQFNERCHELNDVFVAVADSFQNLKQLQDGKIIFIVHPVHDEVVYKKFHLNLFARSAEEELVDRLRKKGYYAISLWNALDSILHSDNRLLYGFEHDGHYSSAGYRLMAEAIYEEAEINYPGFWQQPLLPKSNQEVSVFAE